MNIRELTREDMTTAIELKILCWTEELAGKAENTLDFDKEFALWTDWKDTPDEHNDIRILLGAFDGEKMLGVAFASYIESKDAPEEGIELNGLWIFPEERGRGVSLKLILEIINRFMVLGAPKMYVYNHHFSPSNAFYKKFGGVVVEQELQMNGILEVDIFEFDLSNLKTRLEAAVARYDINIVIRENVDEYMAELRQWLNDSRNEPPESMNGFFAARLGGYEQHMLSNLGNAYKHMAELVPVGAKNILDLGCGTGLELDEILRRLPDVSITGIDLSDNMLDVLRRKHPDVKTVCADYFAHELGVGVYDSVVSFESLHHFKPEKKCDLYAKIKAALKNGGVFILADYIACCDEEETLLSEMARRKRTEAGIPDDVFVHIDTPLTAEHEVSLMLQAGFDRAELVACVQGAAFIVAR